jgi:hypothetical protein
MTMTTTDQTLSLYIPRIFKNYTKEDIAVVFEKLLLGKVSHVDFVEKLGKGEIYNAAYVHFEYWYDTVTVRNFQARVVDPAQEARLVYEEPWYWIVLQNTAKKHISGQPKIRLALDTPAINSKTISVNAPIKESVQVESYGCSIQPRRLDNDFAFADIEPTDEEQLWLDNQLDCCTMEYEEEEEEGDDEYLAIFDTRYVKALEMYTQKLQYEHASLLNQLYWRNIPQE